MTAGQLRTLTWRELAQALDLAGQIVQSNNKITDLPGSEGAVSGLAAAGEESAAEEEDGEDESEAHRGGSEGGSSGGGSPATYAGRPLHTALLLERWPVGLKSPGSAASDGPLTADPAGASTASHGLLPAHDVVREWLSECGEVVEAGRADAQGLRSVCRVLVSNTLRLLPPVA